jgi:hypothetical protein
MGTPSACEPCLGMVSKLTALSLSVLQVVAICPAYALRTGSWTSGRAPCRSGSSHRYIPIKAPSYREIPVQLSDREILVQLSHREIPVQLSDRYLEALTD